MRVSLDATISRRLQRNLSWTYPIIFRTEIIVQSVHGLTDGNTIKEPSPRAVACWAVLVARSAIAFSRKTRSYAISIWVHGRLSMRYIRDCGTSRIISEVSLDVLVETIARFSMIAMVYSSERWGSWGTLWNPKVNFSVWNKVDCLYISNEPTPTRKSVCKNCWKVNINFNVSISYTPQASKNY
jgi:hypothetical protein